MDFRRGQPCISLDGQWSFCYADANALDATGVACISDIERIGHPVYAARVPGNLELDLLANGLIEEPFRGMNIASLTRLERCRAIYYRRFAGQTPGDGVAVLEAQGIDCHATIILNGRVVGTCSNMLIEHRFELRRDDLRGDNEIVVVIDPPLASGSASDLPRLLQAMPANYESLRTRKAPHMYGWDIMPRALSAGIWRPLRILLLPEERITEAFLETLSVAEDHSSATLHLSVRAALADHPHAGYGLRLRGRCKGSTFEHAARLLGEAAGMRFDVASPRLWWPRGRGEPDLYECTLALTKGERELDAVSFAHGIRTASLDRTDVTDESGQGEFCFRVNGERVFALGTNWVPLDAYHSRDADRVGRALELVQDIGCNMIRCWGGNVYESDAFYDLCDRSGILVWQDFAMACAVYPQDEAFQKALGLEATTVVRRLRQHPSLVLWAGDNECDAAFLWGPSGVDPNTNVLTRRVLPEVVRNEDPRRPYLPSSPYIAPEAIAEGLRYLPEDHLWGPRDYYKSAYYVDSLAHFASEIGYHGCPAPETVREFVSEGRDWPYEDNEEWLLHSTSPVPGVDLFDYRVELMARQVRTLFGTVPATLEGFAYASQASQAEAMKFFIEMFRAQKWRRTGIIWWNILDGWPQFSDAVVDYYFRKKRAYRTIRRSQLPLCLVLREPSAGYQELVACNDTRADHDLAYRLSDVETGQELASGAAVVGADAVTVVHDIPHTPGPPRCLVMEWRSGTTSGWNYYLAGNPPFDLDWYRAVMDRLDTRDRAEQEAPCQG